MSMSQSMTTCNFLPSSPQINPLRHNSKTRISITSSKFASFSTPSLFWDNAGRAQQINATINGRRFRVCNVIEHGASSPSESAFNFVQWMGMATMVLPLFTKKWASFLKIKSDVDAAVQIAEGIVEAVEMVADEVEKAAENIADDLPEGGRLRSAVDFVEHIAERASNDAHLVDNFIDQVQEIEDKVEEYLESWGPGASTDHPPKEETTIQKNI